MNWALEYYQDPVNPRVVVIGIADITKSDDALRHIRDAGFSVRDCGVEFRIIQSSLVGAVFTRCKPVNVGPASIIYSGGGEFPVNQALLGGAVGGNEDRSADCRFALSVAHLFNQVCHLLSALSFHSSSTVCLQCTSGSS